MALAWAGGDLKPTEPSDMSSVNAWISLKDCWSVCLCIIVLVHSSQTLLIVALWEENCS